ncbi:alanyl-tRNA synthetase, putative [Babesia ovata]|uniref:Alanyl-tRNA synthetase, putative n=1 Tax=Babesia ovata TaxID=189622 RepID=A0A2H6K8R1_9APIC|nr:alanyl-tRNA synthetase, putative [Babesia ovata]GBE59386.1 alanyl-tRNA synthetase, putative [Babesia ovata]
MRCEALVRVDDVERGDEPECDDGEQEGRTDADEEIVHADHKVCDRLSGDHCLQLGDDLVTRDWRLRYPVRRREPVRVEEGQCLVTLVEGLGLGVVALKFLEITVQLEQRFPQSVGQVHCPAEVGVGEDRRVEGVGPVGDGLHELWAVDVIDATAKQRGQRLGMVLVVVVVGGGRGGAPDALDDMEVVGSKLIPLGAVVMLTGEGGAQRGKT